MEKKNIYAACALIFVLVLIASCSQAAKNKKYSINCSKYITGSARDICYINTGLFNHDAPVCFQSIDKELCYSLIWKESKEQSTCNQIKEQKFRDNCYLYFTDIKNNSSICLQISDINLKDNCLDDMAKRKRNPIDCYEIININLRDKCYSSNVLSGEHISLCSEISDAKMKDNCLKEVGINSQNIGICNSINDVKIKDICTATIGLLKQDVSVCEILHNEARDACLQNIAVAVKNSDVCNKINATDIKAKCLEEANKK